MNVIWKIGLALMVLVGACIAATEVVAETHEPVTPVPVWMSQGIICDTEAQVLQFLDERLTPLPIPKGCDVIQQAIIATGELTGTHEADGFVYYLATYTIGGYRFMTPYGMEFNHFYENGKLVLYTRYGYWDVTAIEGESDVEPVGTNI